jgi:hypothetical protein
VSARFAAQVLEVGIATVLLFLLGTEYGTRAFLLGLGLAALGWLVHDDEPRVPRSDSTP